MLAHLMIACFNWYGVAEGIASHRHAAQPAISGVENDVPSSAPYPVGTVNMLAETKAAREASEP